MLKKTDNTASEIYASYTLNKIDPEILKTMTDEQIAAVKAALIANDKGKKHSIDLRFTISLYFARYYFAFFAGRDRRKSTYLAELYKQQKGNSKTASLMIWIALILLGLLLAILIGVYNYYSKSDMGIDIFSSTHLPDMISDLLK